MNQKQLDNLRVYVYIFLFAVLMLQNFLDKKISFEYNTLILIFTIIALLAVGVVEGMRYMKKKAKP
jgi:hypothetical protein